MWGKDHYASTCPAKRRFSATNSTRSPAASPMPARPSARFPAPQHAPFLDPQIARSASQATEFCKNFNLESVPSLVVDESIDVSSVTNHTQPPLVLLPKTDLSCLSEAAFPVPESISSPIFCF